MKKLFLIGSLVLATSICALETSVDGSATTTTNTTTTTAEVTTTTTATVTGDTSTDASASGDASFDFSFSNLFNNVIPYSNVCDASVDNQCFEVLNANGEAKIQTQNAGADIRLRIRHRAGCHFGYGFNFNADGSFKGGVSVALRDNKTGELITSPVAVEADGDVDFEVDGKAYGDVSVVFLPFRTIDGTCNNDGGFNLEWHFRAEGSSSTSTTTTDTSASGSGGAEFQFRMRVGGNPDQCVQIENPCDSNTTTYISKSDSFAIKPAHFRVHLPSHITQNIAVPVTLEVVDEKGNIIENYNNSSANLDVTFSPNVKAQYAFDIVNGKGSGTVKFLEAVNGVKMEVSDPHFADVDKDDTSSDNRTVDTDSSTSTNSDNSSSTTSDVSSHNPSKYWAGVGTNEPENNPTKNTIDSDIRQNTKKDLHYKKMGW